MLCSRLPPASCFTHGRVHASMLSFNSSPNLLCDDLEGWDGCGEREGIYVYLQLIHVVVQQKIIQRGKPIMLLLKNKNSYCTITGN